METQQTASVLEVLKEAQRHQAILIIFKTWPAVEPNMANESILRSFFAQQGLDPLGWVDQFKQELENNSPLLKSLVIVDEKAVRQRFIDQIVANNGGTPEMKAQLRRDLSAKFYLPSDALNSGIGQAIHGTDVIPTSQLQARAERVATRAELKQKSPEELKQILRDSRVKYTAPTLPEKYTAEYIKANPQEIKNLVRIAGGGSIGYAAVNARLQGRD